MSNLVVSDVGKIPLMNMLVNGTPTFSKVKLFKNNPTISHSTVIADLTEADFGSYTYQSMSAPGVAGSLDASNRAVASWTAVTFTKSGGSGNTIYGYWLESSVGDLLAVEKFDVPIDMSVDGAFIQITPKFTNMSQYLNS